MSKIKIGNVKGQDGFSPTVKENLNNTNDDYRLDITDKNGTFTTPNLKEDSKYIAETYATKVQVDELKSDLADLDDEAYHTKVNLETNVTELKKAFNSDFYFGGAIHKYELPDSFNYFGVDVYTDGRNVYHDFNIERYKNSGGTTYYFSPNGNNYNTGLSEDVPKQSIKSMSSKITDGDTFVLLDGMYNRDFMPVEITKNINIVAKNRGKVIVTNSDNNYVYEKNNNVWQTPRSNVSSVLFKFADDRFISLTRKTSVEEVSSSVFSFASIGGTVYLNVGDFTLNNENTILNLNTGNPLVNVLSTSQNVNLYIDGITFIGGIKGTLYFANSATYQTSKLYANLCNFYGGYGNDYNAVSILGCDSYMVGCKAGYAVRDGFNYHSNNNTICHSIEIDCEGFCNGIGHEQNNNNGSTAHDGSIIMRINGCYHDNKGGNVVDTSQDTKSLNIRCLAFNSLSGTKNGYDTDFAMQSENSEMWLYLCKAFGSGVSMYCPSNNTMHIKKCEYVNKSGGGTFDIE